MSTAGSVKRAQGISSASGESMNITPKINNTVVLQARPLKVKKSNVFKENRSKLRAFLTQAELYIDFNVDKFNENQKKILWASTYFRNKTFD